MATIPQYRLEKEVSPRLGDIMRSFALDVQQAGPPKETRQGAEQIWKCSDELGEAFLFSTCEMNDHNPFGLPVGTIYLMIGPSSRKDTLDAFQRFERALTALGAQRMP